MVNRWEREDTRDPQKPEYRIGAVSKALDLGQYTLKHYERAGLLEPLTAESGYRYYTCSSFGTIISIRGLRRLGFSVEETADLLADNAMATLDRYEERRSANEQAIVELQEANRLLSQRIAALRGNLGRDAPGTFSPHAPGLTFVDHFENEAMVEGMGEFADAAAWREVYECSLLGVHMPADGVAKGIFDRFWWGVVPLDGPIDRRQDGLVVEQERPSDLALRLRDAAGVDPAHVIKVDRGPAIVLSVECLRDGVGASIGTAAAEALVRHGRTLAGDVFAIADDLCRTDAGTLITMTVRIPVKP